MKFHFDAWHCFKAGTSESHCTERSFSMVRVQWLHIFMGYKHNNCASGTLHPPNKCCMKNYWELHAVAVLCENALSFYWWCVCMGEYTQILVSWVCTHDGYPECMAMCSNMSRKPGTGPFSSPLLMCMQKSFDKIPLDDCRSNGGNLCCRPGLIDHYGVIR